MNFDHRIVFVGVLLLLFGAYAHSADLSGNCSSASTQCDISLKELELCNNSPYTEHYNTFFKGAYAEWFSVVPQKVTLEPYECTQLKVLTVANCYAEPGFYTADLVVLDRETLTVTCSLEVRQGHFVDITVEPESQTATQCEEKIYNLVVTNKTIVPNQQIERVDLSISGIPQNWFTLEEERILVTRGKPETVKLHVQAPCDADFGTYDFTARATMPNPNFYDTDNGSYVLSQGQNIKIDLGSEFSGNNIKACLETPTQAKIKIKNTGKLSDNLKVNLEGPDFVDIDKTRLSLDAGKEETLNLTFSETSEQTGNYDVTLKVESTLYDYSTKKTFTVALQDCYNLEIEKLEGEDYVCVESTPEYRFRLTNNKVKPVDLDVSLSGIPADIDKPRLTINPGESKEITAKLNVQNLAQAAQTKRNDIAVEILLDTSGSMVERINGKNKMEVAKTSITELVNSINDIDLGLRAFGQGELCEDSQLLVPVAKLDISKTTDKIAKMEPKGKTPLTQALMASADDFPEGKQKAIILVSDGKETCGGNITETAMALNEKNIRVYTVGFDIDEDGKSELQEIANRTGGKYFDAKKPEELIKSLQQISKELDIIPSKEGKRTFTLHLDSDYFKFEKDFTITVSDCYNATMIAPELNLCAGVEKTDYLTLVNLGSETQEFTLELSPPFVTATKKVTVEPNTEAKVELRAFPGDTSESTYTIRATSSTTTLEQEKSINYLSNASCFGIDLLLLNSNLDASACEGVRQVVFVENRGVTEQTVTLSVDKPYVKLVDEQVKIKPGERKEVSFFVSPPFDLPATTFITISAETDRGFRTQTQVKLNVYNNQDSFGLGEVDLRVSDLTIQEVEGLDYDVELNFDIYNDSNRTLEVFNAESIEYNAEVQLEKRFIGARSTVKARALINLPEGQKAGTITVPVTLTTDEGTYTRNIVFEYKGGSEEQAETDEPLSIGTGLFTLANLSTAILALLIIAVIGLVVFSAFKAVQKEEPKPEEPAKEEDKETAAAKQKLEELKKEEEPEPKKKAKTTKKMTLPRKKK